MMKKDPQFQLEEQIMAAWHVVDDIQLLMRMILDRPLPMTDDEIANFLIGMETVYSFRFEELFNTFEEFLKESHKPKSNPNELSWYERLHGQKNHIDRDLMSEDIWN